MSETQLAHDRSELGVIMVHSDIDDRGLTTAEFRVYCHLIRRAGEKNRAYPGIDSISRVCKISKKTAIEAVRELERQNMLTRKKTNGSTTYYFLTSRSEWVGCKLGNGLNEVTVSGFKRGNGGGANEVTKVNPLKSIHSSPEHQVFIDAWVNNFKSQFGFDYEFDGGRDGKAVKELLKVKTQASELLAIAQAAWGRTTFACRQASTIYGFKNNLNQIRVELKINETNQRNSNGRPRTDRNEGTLNDGIHNQYENVGR